MAMGNTRRRQSIVAHFNRRLTDARGEFLRDATFVQMAAGLRLALARRPGRRVPFGRRRSLRTLGTTRRPGCLLGRHGSFLRLHSRGECFPTIHAYPYCRMACHDCGNRAWLRLVVGCLSPPRRARHRRVAHALRTGHEYFVGRAFCPRLFRADRGRRRPSACVSSESMDVPAYQPSTDRRPPMSRNGEVSSDSAAPRTISRPRGASPPTVALIAGPCVTVARTTLAPPSFANSAAGSAAWLSM